MNEKETIPTPFSGPLLDPLARKVLNQNVMKPVSGVVFGAEAATAANYGNFFAADRAYYVQAITEVHRTAGSDVGAVTLTVEKCASGVAPDSGVVLLSTAFSLKATANTPQFGTLTLTNADRILTRGDRLVLKDAGTLTDVADVCTTVLLQEI